MEKNELLTEDISKIFLKYFIPSIAGMLGTSAYVLGDTMIIGRALGGQGIAALNMVLPMFRIINSIALILGVGGATTLSIYRGQNREDKAKNIFNISMFISLLAGFIFIIVRFFYLDEFIRLLGATDNTYSMVKSYLSIFLFFNGFTILNVTLGIFVRNDGSPKLVMSSILISSFVNLVLDYIFVFKMNLGIWGAALATGIGPIVGLIILSFHFIMGKNKLEFEFPKMKMKEINRILKNGFPSFIIEISMGIVIFLFNIILIKLGGDMAVSAYGIIVNLSLFVSAIFNGVGQAIQPIVSINYGAGNEDRSLEAGKIGMKYSLVLGILITIGGFIFPDELAMIFTKDRGAVIDITSKAIKIYFTSYIFMGLNISLISYIQSKEETRISIIISLLRGTILVIFYVIILSKLFGVNGVWWSVPLAEISTFLLSYLIYEDCREIIKGFLF